ncbi:SPOR domain-containing protein [Sphingomonas daechungensis]|uniref:SPOR domain-containing protein n=1 Tax=Sphingomonas daechungensis TaxID=1176646 RepID=UPI003784DA09
MRTRPWSAAFFLASLAWAMPVAAQAVKSGIDAWQQGDYANAIAIWRPLAEAGDADAAFNMGQAYRLGRGVLVDLGAAQGWFEKAALKGHVDAQATLGLLLFQNGNQADGLKWLKAASEKGDARAMLVYGTALFNGDGVAQNPVLGYAYVSRSAAQGLEPARNTLAQMDGIMPLEQRKKGVALAMQKAKTQTAAPKPKPATPAKSAPKVAVRETAVTSPANGAWRIQLGAFSQRSSAEALYKRLASNAPVAGRQSFLVPAGAVTRLQVGPYQSKAAAAAACNTLSAKGQACFPVPAK